MKEPEIDHDLTEARKRARAQLGILKGQEPDAKAGPSRAGSARERRE